MNRTPLHDYMKIHKLSQTEMAERVALTQGAISKMILKNRSIFVVNEGGSLKLVEEKLVAQLTEELSQVHVA